MFSFRHQDELIRVARLAQRKLCAYDGYGKGDDKKDYDLTSQKLPERCDCKYGGHRVGGTGETNGCPEMREVVDLLAAMTPAEYKRVAARVMKRQEAIYAGAKPKTRKR